MSSFALSSMASCSLRALVAWHFSASLSLTCAASASRSRSRAERACWTASCFSASKARSCAAGAARARRCGRPSPPPRRPARARARPGPGAPRSRARAPPPPGAPPARRCAPPSDAASPCAFAERLGHGQLHGLLLLGGQQLLVAAHLLVELGVAHLLEDGREAGLVDGEHPAAMGALDLVHARSFSCIPRFYRIDQRPTVPRSVRLAMFSLGHGESRE